VSETVKFKLLGKDVDFDSWRIRPLKALSKFTLRRSRVNTV